MKNKIPFLLIIFLFCNTSCTLTTAQQGLRNPPTDFFVKLYKDLRITRCAKKVEPKKKKCNTIKLSSSGSGLIIKLRNQKRVVLSAGHVCQSDDIVEEDKLYVYSWTETVRLIDRNKNFHDAHIITVSQASRTSSDLCTLFVPSLDYLNRKSTISISQIPPKVGEDIYYIGAPLGIHHPPTSLIVRGVFSGKIDDFASLTSTPAAPGASGSVILSLDNKVYGVLFAVHPRFNTASIITNHEQTKKFLLKTEKLLD